MVANGGRVKASLHHDSQSNKGVGSGKGSETVCLPGVQSKPRGFLMAGSSESDSDKRLFRDSEGEGDATSWEGVGDRERRWEVRFGDGTLNSTHHYSLSPKRGTELTSDVYEVAKPDGGQGAPDRTFSASASVGKCHRRCPRSR